MGTLEGKVAYITGAARGQGRSHAQRLAEEGADIIAVDICQDIPSNPYPLATEADLEQTVKLVEGLGRRIVARQADVRDAHGLGEALQDAVSQLGRLDIVVANAGISPMVADPVDDGLQAWRDVIDVNLTGVYNTIHTVVPALIETGGGSVVITSSTAGIKGSLTMGTIGGYGYTAAKHGVVGLMKAFAFDLAQHGIRVNAVHPTGVNTDMVNNEAVGALLQSRPELGASLVNLLPVAVVESIDISNAIAWLVSDLARYVTGVSLPVDAGFTCK
jgi:SDR family mycofactocin-dependent oxidoreductase